LELWKKKERVKTERIKKKGKKREKNQKKSKKKKKKKSAQPPNFEPEKRAEKKTQNRVQKSGTPFHTRETWKLTHGNLPAARHTMH
jgi:hypothetical protein